MEPFSNKKALAEVTKILKKRYYGMYVNYYTPPVTTQTLPATAEPVLTATKLDESKSIENTDTAKQVTTKEVSVSEVEADVTSRDYKSAVEKSYSSLPPWWVILSFLAIIYAAIDGIIETNKRNKTAN